MPTFLARLGAEYIGTFLITSTAIGVDVFYYGGHGSDYSSRWLARGLVAAAVVYAFSEVSGAHVNPAVTIGFFLRRVFPGRFAVGYIIAQFLGALTAAAGWLALVGPTQLGLGTSHPGPHFTSLSAASAESILTFAVVLVTLMTAQERAVVGRDAALAVGFIIASCGFCAGPISGASMNPARTLAPQLLTGAFANMWIYITGPLVGTLAAVGAHVLISGSPSEGQRKSARGGDTR